MSVTEATVGHGWTLRRFAEPAAVFHARSLPELPSRQVWACDSTTTALVLGSAQPEPAGLAERCRDLGWELVRRRSGGGAVLVQPGAQVWVDMFLPRRDPLWLDDVNASSRFVGRLWSAALARLGLQTTVFEGAHRPDRLAKAVCFAGRAAGEVLIDERKAVGISQRRTAGQARFQTAVLLDWHPGELAGLLGETLELAALESRAVGLRDLVPTLRADDVLNCLVSSLGDLAATPC